MFHFTDILCCSRTDFQQSCCKSLLPLILKPIQEQEKKKGGGATNKKTPTKPISNIPEGRRENRRRDITLTIWKASLDMHILNSQHKCHGPIVALQ